MYVYIYIYIYVCMFVCISMYVYVYIKRRGAKYQIPYTIHTYLYVCIVSNIWLPHF